MEQDKTGKYLKYAVGEIVLVVIGILIALQINNWNEERKARLSEQEIIEGLVLEFEGAKFELSGDIRARKEILHTAEYLTKIHLQPDDYSIEPDSLKNALKQLMRARFFTQSHPVLNDLQSSGRLELLSSKSLTQLLQEYLQAKDRLSVFESGEKDFAQNWMSPFIYNNLDLSKVYQSGENDLNQEVFKFNLLMKEPTIGSLLNQRIAVTKEALSYSDTFDQIIDDVLNTLNQ